MVINPWAARTVIAQQYSSMIGLLVYYAVLVQGIFAPDKGATFPQVSVQSRWLKGSLGYSRRRNCIGALDPRKLQRSTGKLP